jgi:hypothetical protein
VAACTRISSAAKVVKFEDGKRQEPKPPGTRV